MNKKIITTKIEKALEHKTIRYLVSGVASQIIDFVSFLLLLLFTNHLIFSNSTSFILGIASGFVFHKLWSFKGDQRFQTRFQIVGYAVLSVFNFIATNILVSTLVDTFLVLPSIAKLGTMIVIAAWSFILFNKVIFRHKPTEKN